VISAFLRWKDRQVADLTIFDPVGRFRPFPHPPRAPAPGEVRIQGLPTQLFVGRASPVAFWDAEVAGTVVRRRTTEGANGDRDPKRDGWRLGAQVRPTGRRESPTVYRPPPLRGGRGFLVISVLLSGTI
jgi:hypothetical protein